MQLLSYFLRKYRFFLFFLFLESIAFYLIIHNHSFHKSKFVSSANFVTGGIYQRIANLKDYFGLQEENNRLIEENLQLQQKLQKFTNKPLEDSIFVDKRSSKYAYTTARIVKNDYTKNYNFLLINKGLSDGIQSEMAVINDKGVLGITEKSSEHYTRVQSILNLDSKINAKLKNSEFFGTLTWNGQDYNIVQLIDVERQAPIAIGDTIVTGERSAIFPEGIPIGTVISTNQEKTTTSSVEIRLFNDMSNLRNAYIVQNKHQKEIRDLDRNNE